MEFQGRALRCGMLENGIVELTFDLQGDSVNKFNRTTMEEFRSVIDEMQKDASLKGLLISSAKDVFIVGADITEFLSVFQMPREELVALMRKQQQIFLDMENLDIPSICALNGYALGGGFEIALASTFRVAAATAKVGLPEVKLGLLPGFGGTSRLPRMIGADNALEWIAAGDEQTAESALKVGAIDAVVEPDSLRISALKMLNAAVNWEIEWRHRREQKHESLHLNENEAMMVFETARAFIAQKAGKNYPAPMTIAGVMQAAAGMPLTEALEIEAEGFVELAKSPEARALIGLFLGDQSLKKNAKKMRKSARQVNKSAVLGAGIMGGGIAYQAAQKGYPIAMKDIASEQLELGLSEVAKILQRRFDRGRIDSLKISKTLNQITPTLSYENLQDADMVIEAVVEKDTVKRIVFQEIEEVVSENAVIASNTSTISINSLASGLRHPERFCGMHFFNPVHRMPLVEIIRGDKSSDSTIATTVAFASDLGKSPVVVNDCPGFLVNRVLFPYFAGFAQLIKEGADYEMVDRIMEKFGWPMGPAWLLDVVGIDTSHHAGGVLAQGYPDRMSDDNTSIITMMYSHNRLGKKNNRGFYVHSSDRKGRPRKERDPNMESILAEMELSKGRNFSDSEIIDRMMLPMLMESSRCLEDGIVNSPSEVDMALIYGLGFPPFRGGIFRWADEVGLSSLCGSAEKLLKFGKIYQPTGQIQKMVANNDVFYTS